MGKFYIYASLIIGAFLFFFSCNTALADNTHTADLELDDSECFIIENGDQTGLDITTDMTIMAWVNWETDPGNLTIASRWDTTGGSNRSYRLMLDDQAGNNSLVLHQSKNGVTSKEIISTGSNLNGNWHHIAMTHESASADVDFYIDGVNTHRASSSWHFFYQGVANFAIGCLNSTNTPALEFDGQIDDVRIYSDILTEQEIQDYYDCQLTGGAGEPDNLVSNWQFNNDATDSAGANDLTEVNNPTYQAVDLPYLDDCSAGQATSSATSTFETDLRVLNNILTITGITEHYDNPTSTEPDWVRHHIFYIPFLAVFLIGSLVLWLFTRLVLEFIIRLRKQK